MIVFNLSRAAAQALAVSAEDNITYMPKMAWYADLVLINRRRCIIAMEESTRYAMVFCGLSRAQLNQFPELFAERLWREVFSICYHVDESAMQSLMAQVQNLQHQVRFQLGQHASVQQHILQVAADLREQVELRCRKLPVDPAAAFSYGIIRVNKVLRQRGNLKEYFVPVDAFEQLCLALIDTPAPIRDQTRGIEPDALDNVIQVNFGRSR